MRVIGYLITTMMLMGLPWSPLVVSATDSLDQVPEIAGPAEALGLALQVTGFGPRMPRVPSAETATSVIETFSVHGDNTPYLADSVNGKELLRVRLDSVDIRPEEAISKGYDQWERKDFEVEIDPVSGYVVRIRTVSRAPQVPPEASAESATAQLARNGERYWGFVDSLTSFSLLQALNAAVGCMPLAADEIVAQLVLYSEGDYAPRPVWVITSRAIPGIEWMSSGQQLHEESSERSRCVIDVATGHWVKMTSTPSPD